MNKYIYALNDEGVYRVQRAEAEEPKLYRSRFDWLPLPLALSYLKQLREAGLSDRFLSQYVKVHGKPRYVDQTWMKKRESALIQMSSRLTKTRLSPWENERPTLDHLRAIAWAHSPIGAKDLQKGNSNV